MPASLPPGQSFSTLIGPDLLRVYYNPDDDPYDITQSMVRRVLKQQRDAMDAQAFAILADGTMGRNSWALIAGCTAIKETDKAILVRVASVDGKGPSTEAWVPKSQLHPEENEINESGDVGMLVIREWLAIEKGWL